MGTLSSGGLDGVEVTLLLEVFNGSVHGVLGLLPDLVGLSLGGKGGGLSDEELLKGLLLSNDLGGKVVDFGTGVRLPRG
jgi:hypothetical protein